MTLRIILAWSVATLFALVGFLLGLMIGYRKGFEAAARERAWK